MTVELVQWTISNWRGNEEVYLLADIAYVTVWFHPRRWPENTIEELQTFLVQ